MTKRLHPTPADYLVIAVSPAMIMTLVGSLIFFILAMLYKGQYPERLHFVLAAFIFAAVLIGRISIEMGSEYALGYATPLAIVTILALHKFVQYPAGALATYSLPINVGLIGLIWWCAHKLTWDCTFIDESKEESGEGVLQTMGLDPRKRGQNSFSSETLPPVEHASPKNSSDPFSKKSRQQTKPQPHSGGVWVVYFSLAALPIFGFGQRFIPAADQEQRRYAFLLLCVYVASGLGLLLTTSFLGLRRYLRGRQLKMPATMAISWVTIGCILAAAILGFALLLPRPSPEYAISELPWRMASADRSASKYSVGREGTPDARKDAAAGEDHSPSDAKKDRAPPPSGPKGTQSGKTAEDAKGGSQEQDAKGGSQGQDAKGGSQEKGDKGGASEQKTGSDSKGGATDQKSADGKDAKGDRGQGQSADAKSEEKGSKSSPDDQSKGGSSADQKAAESKGVSSADKKGSQSKGGGSRGAKSQQDRQGGRSQQSPPPPASPPVRAPQLPSLPLAAALKWLLYLAMAAALAYALWRSRAALADALRDFLATWRAFWAQLFGGKPTAQQAAQSEAAAAPGPSARRLAEFVDPFASGLADRLPPDALVQYSFAALEAWGRENGFPRAPEQTPHEFADGVGDRAKRLAHPSRRLADLYCRVAYAPGTLPAAALSPLREFWERVHASSFVPPAAAPPNSGESV